MRKFCLMVLISLGIYLVFRFLLPLIVPFLVAAVVAALYYPCLRKVYRSSDAWNGPRKKLVLVFWVLLFYIVVFVVGIWLFSYLFEQCHDIWLNLPVYKEKMIGVVQKCCQRTDMFLDVRQGASFAYVESFIQDVGDVSFEGMLPKVTSYSVHAAGTIFAIVFEVVITIMATVYLIQDYEKLRMSMIDFKWGKHVCHIVVKGKETFGGYVKAQTIIMLCNGILCTLSFLVIGQPYYLILGPFVALLDALPILGGGLFLIPYAVYLLVVGGVWKSLVVVLTYIGCVVIRQMVEPRFIGKRIGMRPIFTLLSMYVGYRLFGFIGFLLGPVGVLIGKEIYDVVSVRQVNTLANTK